MDNAALLVLSVWIGLTLWGLNVKRLVLLLALAAGCGGVTGVSSQPTRVESQGCWWTPAGDGLDCLPDTPDGCVCGHHEDDGGPSGSCRQGSCCQGCWSGDLHRCMPGDGTDGLYGTRGADCVVPDWNGCGGEGQACCRGDACLPGSICQPSVDGDKRCFLKALPR